MVIVVVFVLMLQASLIEASPQLENVIAKAHLQTCLSAGGRCNSSSTDTVPMSTTVFSVQSPGVAVQVDVLGAEANATGNQYAIFPDFPFGATSVGRMREGGGGGGREREKERNIAEQGNVEQS